MYMRQFQAILRFRNCLASMLDYRGALAWRSIIIETEPHVCIEIGTRGTLFLWSKWLAAWITGACAQRWRWQTTTSHNMAAIQLISSHAVLDYRIYLWYKTCILCLIDSCHVRWPVSRDHIAGSGLELIKIACFLKLTSDQVLVFVRITGSCQLNLLKTGLDCSEAS